VSQQDWRRIEEIFHAASERTPESRSAFLDTACAGDPELRRQVDLLLSKDGQADSFLEAPALDGFGEQTTATLASPLVGRDLGPYRIVSPLGAGGMGEVYRAHDGKLGRDVAIKTLPAEFARDPARLARFRREARALAALNHPNIAAIYGLEQIGDVDCLVLELVEGETLRGPLPLPIALDRAAQVAAALEAAHEKGIVHRDLKPPNVKVTPEGRVKVLDFGLAKALLGPEPGPDLSQTATAANAQTQVGHIVGTPGYMSPEQARGQEVDQRTDIWAFGCLLYELLTGKRVFQANTVQDTIAAVLEREPDWSALPPKAPAKIRELLRQCLQKDAARRLFSIADARRAIEQAQRGWNRWAIAAVAAVLVAAVAVGGVLWMRPSTPVSDPSKWVQLTKFPDSVSQPALSPDGKMLAFIHGPSTFFGPGQIYVKILPDGDPVEVTHDDTAKLYPVFSPDGTRIAYGTYLNQEFAWDTWSVPVLGGEPKRMFKNATGLVWTSPGQLLFSEIKMGIHMGVVAADENRVSQRDVYLPMTEPSMAHYSYLSPDGKWVLLVEMDDDHLWEPCRVVPFDASSPGHKVGPPKGGCTAGAWSPDGKWIYLTSNASGGNHIWRQRFPDGQPEQVTSGPTEEEGIAMAPDGRSFITAVALQNTSLWMHDSSGDRQISLEGNGAQPKFTPDGKKLLYRVVGEPPSEWGFYRDAGEVRIVDLASGRSEPVVRGLQTLDYDLSTDGSQIVMQTEGADHKPQFWLAPLDHSAPPRQIPGIDGGFPMFLPDGEILFRRTEGGTAFNSSGTMYRVHLDGTGMRKAFDTPVLIPQTVSPDGQWLIAWAPVHGDGPPAIQAFPLGGGTPVLVTIGGSLQWSPDGRYVSFASATILAQGRSYVIPLPAGQALPPIPAGGFTSEEQVARLPGARKIDVGATISDLAGNIFPGPSPDVYVFYRGRAQRNLYRIPIP
jgi:serine/threonine protein kinase/Tol biopolymer transport system component